MDKEKKMPQQKKVTFCNLSSKSRKAGREKMHAKAKENTYKDSKSTQRRRLDTIKKAANGKWWIEQYLMGSLISTKTMTGIDDE